MSLRWSGIAVAVMLAGYLMVLGVALITKVTVPAAKTPGGPGKQGAGVSGR